MLEWLRRLFLARGRERENSAPADGVTVPSVTVTHDGTTIRLRDADGTAHEFEWSELASVTILTTDAGPFANDLFWLLARRDRRHAPLTVPMGAAGEHELLLSMQSRLPGFDNMAVVEAMSSTANASFLVWDHNASREPGAG